MIQLVDQDQFKGRANNTYSKIKYSLLDIYTIFDKLIIHAPDHTNRHIIIKC